MKRLLFPLALLVLLATPGQTGIQPSRAQPRLSWFPKATPLPSPAGDVIRVNAVEELYSAAERVRPGGTILVAGGVYRLPRFLEIRTDRVSLRGATGRPEDVVFEGGGMGELLKLTACADVTGADLTVQNVRWNGIKINSETGVQRATIHNCLIHNVWQRGLKGVLVPEENRDRLRPTGFRVQYCLFYNDHAKRFEDDASDTAETFGGNYIGGMDIMYARGWTIRDNVFIGIQGRTRSARGAIFMWHDAEDCVIERNVIIDCDSGVCLGNSFKRPDTPVHATRFLVRNNFITRAPEQGILADYTRDCKILHNTVHDPQNRLGRLIRLVHDNDGLVVANNLLSGPPLRNESSSRMELRDNPAGDFAGWFAAPGEGNLHVNGAASGAIDRAPPLPDVREDIDGILRGPKPDLGADEFGAP